MLNKDQNPITYLRPYRTQVAATSSSTSTFNNNELQKMETLSESTTVSRSRDAISSPRRMSLNPSVNMHLNWVTLKDNQGRTYYYNPDEGTVQWEKPTAEVLA